MNRETLVNAGIIAALVLTVIAARMMENPFIITLVTKVCIFAIAGIGLNLALGYGGMVSFGHAAFFGLGGYAMGILASHAQSNEPLVIGALEIAGTKSMPLIWLAAIATAGLAAALIGALSLRTSGVYFIMITLAFAQMVFYFAISWPAYGGEDGLSIYVRNSFPGLNTLDPLQFFALVAIILALVLFLSMRLVGSRFGMALQATRQNPQRVASVGISPYRVKLVAFIMSGAITGLAGALYADLNRFVSPSMLSWQTSGEIMVFVILGGIARPFGPLAGAGLYIILEHLLGGLTEFWQFWLGLLLLGVVLFVRGGLIGALAGERRHG